MNFNENIFRYFSKISLVLPEIIPYILPSKFFFCFLILTEFFYLFEIIILIFFNIFPKSEVTKWCQIILILTKWLFTEFDGTLVKFQAIVKDDLITSKEISSVLRPRYQSITIMPEYENKSFEELRLADYFANRISPLPVWYR